MHIFTTEVPSKVEDVYAKCGLYKRFADFSVCVLDIQFTSISSISPPILEQPRTGLQHTPSRLLGGLAHLGPA